MVLNLDSTLGAAFVGNIAAAVLYGITVIQTFIFFRACHRDRLPLKIIIFVLWVLDTLHLIFVSHAIYYYTVSSFTNLLALLTPTWSILAQIFVTCISDLLVRYVFGRRVWRLSGNSWLLAIIITSFTVFTFGAGMTFGVKAIQLKTYARTATISWLFYSSLASAVVVDCIFAISLCILLLRSRTGHKGTDSLMNVLMLYSINTGMITSLAAIICFITYAIMPNNYYYMGVFFILSKLNLNCMLASLNARTPLRDQIGLPTPNVSSKSDSTKIADDLDNDYRSPTDPSAPLAIRIDTITESKLDSYKVLKYAQSPASTYGPGHSPV